MTKREKMQRFETKGIYGITAENLSAGRKNSQVVREMLEAGIRIIQYREKKKSMAEKYEECLELRRMTRDYGALFIVNDHPDLCLLTDADGVHVGQDDYPVAAVRGLIGPERILGWSTHEPRQLQEAHALGVDYAGVGPLFETHTKEDVMAPVGLSYLEWAVANTKIPFVAIGGIKEHNFPEVASRGAKCICLVSEITENPDIRGKIKRLLDLF
ncbi:MAG TPA: thiamine phosphate synthase [Syntrophales bacterium]|jgi:thiamine-phosphate pyrophosphorylase|nr:thiamine phosphate synthase [Syntrophales bacterium]HPX57085.1 thiamine phosphate synthase [Syntrophales bacterium]HQA83492.1 thiamine phosphate synthase [Syntrophales bacterium]